MKDIETSNKMLKFYNTIKTKRAEPFKLAKDFAKKKPAA